MMAGSAVQAVADPRNYLSRKKVHPMLFDYPRHSLVAAVPTHLWPVVPDVANQEEHREW